MNKYILILWVTLVVFSFSCKETMESVEKNYPDGTRQYSYFVNKYNEKNGQSMEYFPNGQLKSKIYFVKGLEEGRGVYYYETGELKEVQYFNKGKKNGPDTLYSQDGLVRNISNFKNGLKHGIFIKFKIGSDSLDIESFYSNDSLVSLKKHE